ncbi:hypothetical protein [Streptomyces cylindrosporus]|uniref:Integral membrane protein n=1 Tax=Streptomyces cylindrosporus TaxID=2927583 RepID=A0ABS9XXI1_9ACTN|nr:hypothetical protein [Streptomyces cylindrosporus]MCI3269658.1 hypothetical protein [Streptomyces cylindrosporus]
MTQPVVLVGQLLLLEYQQLKEEQRSRIGFRDNLLYATLASVAAVAVAGAQSGRLSLLLLLPAACLVLRWTYLANDQKVSPIGRYVREELDPRLADLTGSASVFGWESAHRIDPKRRLRKLLQLCADLLTFCGTAAAGVTVFWCSSSPPAVLFVVSLAEAAATAVLAWQFIFYAETAPPSVPATAAD